MMRYGARAAEPSGVGSGLLALGAILLLGAGLRCWQLFSHTTTVDEAFTFFIASHSLPQIVSLLERGDFHPPLVYVIGHILFFLTAKAYTFRIVSVVFGLVGIAATYAVAQRVIPRWALLATLFVAVCPSLVFFDRFFRMYAILWPLCMLSWAALLWALEQERALTRWLGYTISCVLLLYTQYLAVFTLAAQAVYVLALQPRLVRYWLALGVAGLAFVPWLPIFLRQYPLGGSAYSELRGHLGQMVLAPSVMLLDGLPHSLEYNIPLALVIWVLLLLGIALALLRRQWLALALLVPIGLQVLYSLASGKLLLGQRYLLQGIPPAALLITVVIAWLSASRARVAGLALAAALLVLMLFGTADELFLAEYQPIDWTVYGRFLTSKLQPGDAVVFDGAMPYYALIGTAATTRRPLFLVADRDEIPALARAADRFARVWYVDYQSQLPDPRHAVWTSLARSHPRHQSWQTTQAGYGDVVLTTFFVKPAARKRGP